MQAEPTTGLRKLAPIQKAARLIAEDRVHRVTSAQVYIVDGDTDTYRVVACEEGIFCPCRARTMLCSHTLAVAQLRERDRLVKEIDVDELWRRVGAAPLGEVA